MSRELCVDWMIKRSATSADVDIILALFGMSLMSDGKRISAILENFCCNLQDKKAIVMQVSRTT